MTNIGIISSIVVLAWMCSFVIGKSIPNRYQDDSEVEYVTSSPGNVPNFPGNFPGNVPGWGIGPGNGRGNVFTDWMNWVQGFFKEGNWDNGGPGNFAQFLGNQVAKLIDMLTKDGGMFSRK